MRDGPDVRHTERHAAAFKGGLSETQADAVVDVMEDATSGLATKDDLIRAMHQLRMELWRAIAFQTIVFTGIVTGIVAALTKL